MGFFNKKSVVEKSRLGGAGKQENKGGGVKESFRAGGEGDVEGLFSTKQRL